MALAFGAMKNGILFALCLAGLVLSACGEGTEAKPESSSKPDAKSTTTATAAATASAKPTAEPKKDDSGW